MFTENSVFKGLAHIGIFTDNFEETLYFYTKQFPFEIIKKTMEEHPDDTSGVYPLKYAIVKLGHLYLEIMECHNKGYTALGVAGTWDHIGISVLDVEKAVNILKNRGVPEEWFGEIVVNSALNPNKIYRSCTIYGRNGEKIGLYELDNDTFFAE